MPKHFCNLSMYSELGPKATLKNIIERKLVKDAIPNKKQANKTDYFH